MGTETKTEKTETKTEKTETEAKTSPTTEERLAAQGFFQSGRMWNLGLGQDVDNMLHDPTWGGKIFHASSATLKLVGLTAVGKSVYNRSARYLAARAASKAASQLTGLQVGQALETAAQATAACCTSGEVFEKMV